MLFLTVSIVLLLTGGSLGRAMGGIRMAVSLVGVILAGILAFKVGPGLHGSIAKMGVGPLWSYAIPPIAIFVVVMMIFNSLAQFVHLKYSVYYRYKAHDDDRVLWEKLNDKMGLCFGLFNGVAYVIVGGLAVYIAGYLCVQVRSPKSNPRTLAILATLRESMKESGLEKTIAAFDPTPVTYYHFADLIGLIYNNPDIGQRLATYPMLMGLAEDGEILSIAHDQQFTSLIANRENISLVLRHPKVEIFVNSGRPFQIVNNLDLPDLIKYIETGKTDKFKDEKLLGTWEIYVPATVTQIKAKHPQITIQGLSSLKKAMNASANDLTLVASADGQMFLKGSLGDNKALTQMMTGVVPAGATNSTFHVMLSGTWKRADKDYVLTFKGGPSGDQSEGASIRQNESLEVLTTSFFGGALVMTRVD